ASTPESQRSSFSVSKVTEPGGGSAASACSTGAVAGRPCSSSQLPASRTSSVPSGPRVTVSRSSSAASARRSPELLTAIFPAPRLPLPPRGTHKLARARTRPALPSRRDELDAFAAHEPEALDLEPERRELARRGIACASRPESVKHEGRDPEQAA